VSLREIRFRGLRMLSVHLLRHFALSAKPRLQQQLCVYTGMESGQATSDFLFVRGSDLTQCAPVARGMREIVAHQLPNHSAKTDSAAKTATGAGSGRIKTGTFSIRYYSKPQHPKLSSSLWSFGKPCDTRGRKSANEGSHAHPPPARDHRDGDVAISLLMVKRRSVLMTKVDVWLWHALTFRRKATVVCSTCSGRWCSLHTRAGADRPCIHPSSR
jgi:hypothetical protein